jgi:hypothetical protein
MKLASLEKLERLIKMRLLCDEKLPTAFKSNYIIEKGCVTFVVALEFKITLTIYLGSSSNTWKIMSLEFLCNSATSQGDYQGFFSYNTRNSGNSSISSRIDHAGSPK